MFWQKEKEVTVTFKTDGTIEVEGHGFVGKACEKATAFIEKLLGTVRWRKTKPDAYKQGVQNVRLH